VEPGFVRGYSNAGYVLLGLLVQRVSGKPSGEFLRETIFEPLGMATARVIEEAPIIPDRAAGYELVGGQLRNQHWVAPTYNRTGDGHLYFSIDDLIRWDAALDQGRVLSRESMKLMWSPVKTGVGAISEYGFGWALDGIKGHARVHHSGGWQGFTTSFQRYPDDHLTVIVLTNLGPPHGRPGEIAEAVAKHYFAGPR
jgi:CubicO group peptidase (beta-lactamase class C family)